jgi:uncharacterized membrane protein YozB (DUF420 family)
MISWLPALNASLNALSALLLVYGYVLIRRGDRVRHPKAMQAAFGTSCLFLVSYLVYHAQAGSVPFHHEGTWLRTVYLTILGTHTLLAAAVPVLAILALSRGRAGRFEAHRKVARWALPVWLYVSVTGVVVYAMLYHMA